LGERVPCGGWCTFGGVYEDRQDEVKDAVREVSLTGDIGKPLLTLLGTFEALLPIRSDSDVHRLLVKQAGHGSIHRYYEIDEGNHVDSYFATLAPIRKGSCPRRYGAPGLRGFASNRIGSLRVKGT
jgi:hypothetical protein